MKISSKKVCAIPGFPTLRSSRELFAAACVALIGTRASAQRAQASIRLNWYLGGSHGAFVLGKERGFYAEEGIDLAINEGRGSVRSVQLVDSREDSFAMTDAGSLMLGVARGARAQAVMTVVGVSSFCVVARKDSGIASIRDLQGKRDRKSTRLNSSHIPLSRMPSSA